MFGPPYRKLARFAGNLALSIQSGVPTPKAMSLALRALDGTSILRALNDPVRQVKQGESIATALEVESSPWPSFVLPAIKAGEESGRLEEALFFVEKHCDMLVEPMRAIRNAWLIPLCILLVGDVACAGICWALGSFADAISFLWHALIGWMQTALFVGVFFLPFVKPYVDRIRLLLPGLGGIERNIANFRFFRILGLMYGVADLRVDAMIEVAADGVSNTAARTELEKAASAVRRQETVEEAFRHPQQVLSQDQMTSIAAGEIAGKLEETWNRLADEAEASLDQKLAMLQQLTVRWVMFIVCGSLVAVAWRYASR